MVNSLINNAYVVDEKITFGSYGIGDSHIVNLSKTESSRLINERRVEKVKINIIPNMFLRGAKRISSCGVTEWFNFPRYRVVGLHVDGCSFFIETLGEDGVKLSERVEKFPIDNDQFMVWSS